MHAARSLFTVISVTACPGADDHHDGSFTPQPLSWVADVLCSALLLPCMGSSSPLAAGTHPCDLQYQKVRPPLPVLCACASS
jgi:hypothetical protein